MVVDATDGRTIEPCIINGYDGFGGCHNNMLWNWQNNFVVYTLNNKLIIEDMKTRRQQVFADSQVRLSSLATSSDNKMIAVGEGETNPNQVSLIYLYSEKERRLLNKLTFH